MNKYLLEQTLSTKTWAICCLLLLANLLPAATRFSTEDTTVYEKADRAPRFKGDPDWIIKQTYYPNELKGKDIKGNVTVSFIVEKDGSVSHVTLVEGCHPGLDTLLFNAVKNNPTWEPAMINGKPVRFRKTEGVRYCGKPKITIFPKDPVISQAYSRYLQDLYKEEEAITLKKELSREEKTKKINTLKEQFRDDASFQKILLAALQENKTNLDSIVKAQSIPLKLDTKGAALLKEIYQNELAEKIKLIQSIEEEQFISKFVEAELQLRQIELNKTLAIEKLLDKEFYRYFEFVVLKE